MGLRGKLVCGQVLNENKDSAMVSESFLNKLGVKDYKDVVGKTLVITEGMQGKDPLNIDEKISGVYKTNKNASIYPYEGIPLYDSSLHTYFSEFINTEFCADIITYNNVYKNVSEYYEGGKDIGNTYRYLSLVSNPNANVEANKNIIKYGTGYLTASKENGIANLKDKYAGIESLFNGVGFLVITVSVILFMNSMIMSLDERTKWYGILRSLGLKVKYINRIIFIQCLIIGFVSWIISLIGSFIVTTVMNMSLSYDNLRFVISSNVIWTSVKVSIITVLVVFFISFLKIDKMNLLKSLSKD